MIYPSKEEKEYIERKRSLDTGESVSICIDCGQPKHEYSHILPMLSSPRHWRDDFYKKFKTRFDIYEKIDKIEVNGEWGKLESFIQKVSEDSDFDGYKRGLESAAIIARNQKMQMKICQCGHYFMDHSGGQDPLEDPCKICGCAFFKE